MRKSAAALEPDLAHEQQLSDGDMQRIARTVYDVAGIVLDNSRRALVVGRLAKRLRALNLRTYREYVRYLDEDKGGAEVQNLINAITTNKTSFFRESHHFTFLRERIEERMHAARRNPELQRIHIWSAGCSTGEEPYSIAMTVARALGAEIGNWDVRIVATDIDSDVLSFAKRGVYGPERTVGMPAGSLGYFDKVTREDGTEALAVRPELRKLISFERLNFMDSAWPVRGQFDHVFCRNVTIYFDRPTQAKLYPRLLGHLSRDGYFFAGHSENLSWLPELLRPAGLTTYVHADADGRAAAPAGRPAPPPQSGTMRAVRPPPVPATVVTHSRRGDLPEKSLQAGDVVATSEPMVLRTTLGSCISVCMYDPTAKIGGMNHFMLPSSRDENEKSNRFGIQAMETLINKLLKLGAARHRLVAKIAGACHVIDVSIDGRSVADRNLEFVEHFMATEGFTVAGRKVGGRRALEVRLNTSTGEAQVREVDASVTTRVAHDDEAYAERLAKPKFENDGDGVTWFR